MARKKLPVKKRKAETPPSWAAIGFDISGSSVAGAGIAWDATLKKFAGPVCVIQRWNSSTDYFQRLSEAAKAHVFVQDIMAKLLLPLELEQIHIGVEEPWPLGLMKSKTIPPNFIKQQAQISGAFLGGLVRYGYPSVEEVNNQVWKNNVKSDLGRALKRGVEGKWDVKEWALDVYEGIPDWPDLINKTGVGKIPQPETSKAKPVQPDDRYDALGIMGYMQTEIEEGNIVVVRPTKRGASATRTVIAPGT